MPSAKMMRNTNAAMMPIMMTLRRWSAGRPAANAPTTIALSPARTMSIIKICKIAAIAAGALIVAAVPATLAFAAPAADKPDFKPATATRVGGDRGPLLDLGKGTAPQLYIVQLQDPAVPTRSTLVSKGAAVPGKTAYRQRLVGEHPGDETLRTPWRLGEAVADHQVVVGGAAREVHLGDVLVVEPHLDAAPGQPDGEAGGEELQSAGQSQLQYLRPTPLVLL